MYVKMEYSYIPTSSKNMTAAESTGTSNRMKEQYEKHEKFVRGFLLFSPQKGKIKAKEERDDGERMRKVVEIGTGKVESVNKNLGGEKKKK